MKLVGIIGTALLSLTLGVAAPAYAQEHEQQEQEKGKPAPEEKKAQPEKPAAKPAEKAPQKEEKNAKPQERSAQPQDKNNHPAEKTAQQQHTQPSQPQKQEQRAATGRIPDDRFKANFGRQHTFRVSQGDYRNHRFQYGGYTFGFVDPWPSNWLYTQNVYVVEIDGIYYLCNPAYPGVNLALSFTL
jgi:hypothetical protein